MMRVLANQMSRAAACAASLAVAAAAGVPVLAAQNPTPPPAQNPTPPVQSAAAPAMPDQTAPPAAPTGPALQLSMEQAVQMALDTNLGIKSQRLGVDVAAQGTAAAHAAFQPQLSSGFTRVSSQSVPTDFTQGSAIITSHNVSANGSVLQALPWLGGGYQVSWSGNRATTLGGNSSFNPRFGSSLSVSFSQPLWRNFLTDGNRVNVATNEHQQTIADIRLQEQLVGTEAGVRNAYLSLVGAIEGQKVAQQNMDLATESLKEARARVAVGTSAQIDIVQADAQVASMQEQLIVAQAQIGTAEDALRSLIMDPARPDYWQVHLVPTDSIELTPRAVDVDAAIKTALSGRLDLAIQKRSLEITDLNVRLDRNNTHPQVNLNVNYTATGTGGTQLVFGSGFPPPVLSRTDKSFSSVLGDTFGGAYPTWQASVSVAYPLGRSAAEASLAEAQLQRQQQAIGLQALQLQIVQQVREAAREVESSYQRVQATGKALEATQRQLDAEKRRFDVGLSTTFELQQRQLQLAQARQSDLNAKIAYNRALITLDAVLKIGQ
jgi:outer membrane protein